MPQFAARSGRVAIQETDYLPFSAAQVPYFVRLCLDRFPLGDQFLQVLRSFRAMPLTFIDEVEELKEIVPEALSGLYCPDRLGPLVTTGSTPYTTKVSFRRSKHPNPKTGVFV